MAKEAQEKKFYVIGSAAMKDGSELDFVGKGYVPHTIAEHEALIDEMVSATAESARKKGLNPEAIYKRWNSPKKPASEN